MRSAVNYDVRSDGNQFVAVVSGEEAQKTAPTLDLYINWRQALARRRASP